MAVGLFAATPALARRGDKREGFNFGTTVRILDNNERTNAGLGSDKNTKVNGTSQAVNPYLGYAFGPLNLGFTYSAEQQSSQIEEASEDGLTIAHRDSTLNSKGGALFARFLFGDVFFFEAAGGVYQQNLTVKTETKRSDGTTAFTGEEDSYQVKGVGPGYHMGAGLELEMGNGFYFTSAYQVRIVQLRDHNGGSDFGAKRSQMQKREALFGIAHYTK